jgi:nitrite reductase/ring-hydroxylating ferredoxin subunit
MDMTTDKLIPVCTVTAVPEGQGLQIAVDGLVLAVFRVHDRYYVIDDACTHGPGSLSEGEVDGDLIECNFHNGVFNIRTGEVVAPPCMIAVRTYYAEVRDGYIFIDRDRPAAP